MLGASLSMSHLFSLATHASTGTQCIQLPANELCPLSSACHSLPTATEDWRDSTLLIISPVVNSGSRIWPIQLTAWQLLWLSRLTLDKTYFCQYTKKIWRGEDIHMVTFSNWLLKNVLRIFGKMPVFKDRNEILYRKYISCIHCIYYKCYRWIWLWCFWKSAYGIKKNPVRVVIQNMPADSLQFLAIQRETWSWIGTHSKEYNRMTTI